MSESPPSTKLKINKALSRTPSSWDPQDDLLLRHLKEQQKLGWKEIASHFAHRTPNACQFRWRRLRSGSLKTSTNSPTPTSGTNTPPLNKNPDSSSNSTSPPQVSSILTKDKEQAPLVSKFSSKPKEKKPPLPKTETPSYKWSFNTSESNTKTSSISMDPLNSSTFQNLDSDEDDDKNSSVFVEQTEWTIDEDDLLSSRRSRSLSFAELSILLPLRSEDEIITRIEELDKKKTKRSNSSKHIHPHPLHTPTRSYSSSSQTSLSKSNQLFISQDTLRSKSFSYITPYSQSTDRYQLRKNSITNSIINQDHKSRSNSFLTNPRSRSNSFLRETYSPLLSLNHVLSNDRERLKRDSSSSDIEDEELKIEPKLPPLGSIFNDLYTK